MKNGGSLKFNLKMWFSLSDCVFVHLWMNEWIICSKKLSVGIIYTCT